MLFESDSFPRIAYGYQTITVTKLVLLPVRPPIAISTFEVNTRIPRLLLCPYRPGFGPEPRQQRRRKAPAPAAILAP